MRRRLVIAGSLLLALAAGGGAVAGCGHLVARAGKGRLYEKVADVPPRGVGLLLGTSDKRRNGSTNPFFTHRIEAAAALYKAGKVRHLLISGDNRRKDYDEPTLMKEALLKEGVPEAAMTLDYAGFRTLDSVIRAKIVFRVRSLTIISQRFHDERALMIADQAGLEAFARVRAVLDVYVFHTMPKFSKPDFPESSTPRWW
jgi:SanA protein